MEMKGIWEWERGGWGAYIKDGIGREEQNKTSGPQFAFMNFITPTPTLRQSESSVASLSTTHGMAYACAHE